MQTDSTTESEPQVRCDDGLGRWFYAEYGFSVVTGQCVARVRNGGYMLRFRWGNPYRTTQHVEASRILGEAQDPRWLSKLWRLLKRPNDQALPQGGAKKGNDEH